MAPTEKVPCSEHGDLCILYNSSSFCYRRQSQPHITVELLALISLSTVIHRSLLHAPQWESTSSDCWIRHSQETHWEKYNRCSSACTAVLLRCSAHTLLFQQMHNNAGLKTVTCCYGLISSRFSISEYAYDCCLENELVLKLIIAHSLQEALLVCLFNYIF